MLSFSTLRHGDMESAFIRVKNQAPTPVWLQLVDQSESLLDTSFDTRPSIDSTEESKLEVYVTDIIKPVFRAPQSLIIPTSAPTRHFVFSTHSFSIRLHLVDPLLV